MVILQFVVALLGKTAIVTGASSGIGKATALLLAGEGCHVFTAGRSAERLQEVARSIGDAGGQVTVGAFDLHDHDRLQAFVAEAVLLPTEGFVGDQMQIVDPEAIFAAREALRQGNLLTA